MFTKDNDHPGVNSQKRAAQILANYGATHFLLMPDGELHAVAGTQQFKVEGENVSFVPSDTELAEHATAAAIEKAAG